ncbi:MAG TPA: hypothetical protein VJU61_21340 [Polyangiaceae bacterium]|nr:hypothetical protein [Polyangiaceae bacterium]
MSPVFSNWFRRGIDALLGRRATWAATAALAAYALGVVIAHQVRHTYPSTRPPPLEDQRVRELPLGQWLKMPDPRLESLLGHGWYGMESNGQRWSAGMSSVLSLPAQEPGIDLSLTLRLTAADDGEHSQNRVKVSLHGRKLATLDVDVNQVKEYKVRVPRDAHQGYPILLTLSYEFSVQPSYSDSRAIAVQLLGLRLREKPDSS